MRRIRELLSLFVLGVVLGAGSIVVPIGLRPLREAQAPAFVAAVGNNDPTKPPLRVIFFGNSHVRANRLPDLIAQLARADGQRPFTYRVEAPGAASLERHVQTGRYKALLASERFDFAVLQEQSQRPSYRAKYRERQMKVPARTLDSAVRASGPKTLLFVTWARRDGDSYNLPEDTYERMQTRVDNAYQELADELNAVLAPVGLVWREVHEKRPSVQLWMPNGNTPTMVGSYLAACVFYTVLYGRPVGPVPYDMGFDPELMGFIRVTVDRLAEEYGFRGGPDDTSDNTDKRPRPSALVAGIVPPKPDGCGPAYDLRQDVCYHRELHQDRTTQQRLIADYKRGVRPPLMRPGD